MIELMFWELEHGPCEELSAERDDGGNRIFSGYVAH